MRHQYQWGVAVQTADGKMHNTVVAAYWDPEHPLTSESVGHAAINQVKRETGQVGFPVKVEQVA